jgi:hypothetical protein
MPDAFTIERFLPCVGEVFHIVSGESTLPVLLTEISRLPTDGSKLRTREPFSLVFHAPPGTAFGEQQICRIEKPGMEPFDAFLVPIGPDRFGMRIEAIYT